MRPGWLTVPAADPQILNDDHCVVFADGRCDFVKVVPADIGDTRVQSLHFTFCFVPIVAELDLSAQGYCTQPREQPQGGQVENRALYPHPLDRGYKAR